MLYYVSLTQVHGYRGSLPRTRRRGAKNTRTSSSKKFIVAIDARSIEEDEMNEVMDLG